MTTRRGGNDPILLALRHADCVLTAKARIGGPSRARSILDEIGNVADLDPSPEQEAIALDHKAAVEAIADRDVRRVLAEAMDTYSCTRMRTVREVAAACQLPVTKTHRLLRRGIGMLVAQWEQRAAA
jgi:hypothetical protein